MHGSGVSTIFDEVNPVATWERFGNLSIALNSDIPSVKVDSKILRPMRQGADFHVQFF
jgi:hypothetical protein